MPTNQEKLLLKSEREINIGGNFMPQIWLARNIFKNMFRERGNNTDCDFAST